MRSTPITDKALSCPLSANDYAATVHRQLLDTSRRLELERAELIKALTDIVGPIRLPSVEACDRGRTLLSRLSSQAHDAERDAVLEIGKEK